ncbi:uncharacterized protein LOC114281408 [Camellia sinensis]|uniref:uncharacterized protein LOC114281408 n=1 Tax=Camellia sinensis TaxID=4442 RepID=UPI001035D2A1|nr:uncharacterized protein LOC114281408 [Camellia sinensis]
MDVDREGSGAAVGTDDVGSMGPSLNCWQVDTPNAGNIKMKGRDDYENKNTGTPTSKVKVGGKIVAGGEVWPVLFPDLLELSSTPDGEAVGEEQGGVNDELRSCNVKIAELESQIQSKDPRVRELEQRVEMMEQLLGRHDGNLFVDLNSVIVEKGSEIDRLNKVVDRLESKISNLQDSLDDFEVYEVTQCVVNDRSNQRTPSNSLSGKVSGSGHITSVESAQHSTCPVGQPKYVDTTELQIVENDAGIEDLTADFSHGNVHPTVVQVEGSCSPRNEQPTSDGNVNVGTAVVGVGTACEHTNAETISRPKMTSLVKRVKTKPRREFRLSDYEYPVIFGRQQVNANVRLGKSFEPGVIYSAEDVEVKRKIWHGFGMNRRHTVWNMLKDEDRQLLERMYSLERDGLIVWDSGHNGIQVHFTDIKDLVQQNSIHGNVIDAYAAMLTEMRKTMSGKAEFVGTTYVYTSVCSDMMRNSSAMSRTKYLNVHMKAARGYRYTLFPIYNANHWTVMAHNSESGNWKHYNSMRPRRGVRDEHYNEALKVK